MKYDKLCNAHGIMCKREEEKEKVGSKPNLLCMSNICSSRQQQEKGACPITPMLLMTYVLLAKWMVSEMNVS